jgi:hypothetical protein
LFFLNLSQIHCLIISSEHDLYPPHQVDADLSDNTGEDQRQTGGDDVEGPGIPSIELITSNPIGSSMAAPVCPPAVDQPVSTVPLSGGQKRKRIRLASKCKITTSDQVITELHSCHLSRNRSNLVSVNLVFGRLFEAFQHISQGIETDAMAGADIQPPKENSGAINEKNTCAQVFDALNLYFTACDFSSIVLIICLSVGTLRVVNHRSQLLLPWLSNLHCPHLLQGQLFQQLQLLLMPCSIVAR